VKLEVGYIDIKGIRFGDYNAVEDGILIVNPEPLLEPVLEDPLIKSAHILRSQRRAKAFASRPSKM
jgi:hypothetical protein